MAHVRCPQRLALCAFTENVWERNYFIQVSLSVFLQEIQIPPVMKSFRQLPHLSPDHACYDYEQFLLCTIYSGRLLVQTTVAFRCRSSKSLKKKNRTLAKKLWNCGLTETFVYFKLRRYQDSQTGDVRLCIQWTQFWPPRFCCEAYEMF